MSGYFWLGDEAWAAIALHLPTNQPGAHRTDDRRVIRDATVKRFHYDGHDQLRRHPRDFIDACNFGLT